VPWSDRGAAHVIETMDQIGIALKRFGRGDIFDAVLFPQSAAITNVSMPLSALHPAPVRITILPVKSMTSLCRKADATPSQRLGPKNWAPKTLPIADDAPHNDILQRSKDL
jgi:hypothetical protein